MADDFSPRDANELNFPPTEGRFVRLVIEQWGEGGGPCIDELEVYGPASAQNLALAKSGAKATASSCLVGYWKHRVAHLNDGRYGNSASWIAATSRTAAPEWAQIELPQPTPINRVVFGRDQYGVYADRMPLKVHVEISVDGQQWARVEHTHRVLQRTIEPERSGVPPRDYARLRRWDFDETGNAEGWTVPDKLTGAVQGGALWLTLQPVGTTAAQFASPGLMIHPNPSMQYEVASPTNLALPTAEFNQVRWRLLNRSPATDAYVLWRQAGQPGRVAGSRRVAVKPHHPDWQIVTCHLGGRWSGTVDQILLWPGPGRMHGDLWFDWIEVLKGEPEVKAPRPDVCSAAVVPHLTLPGVAPEHFQDAFKVLDECLWTDVPMFGFEYPVMGPGGGYGENWWQLDSSLNVVGAKWANQSFAEGVVRGFAGVQAQNPDGRIDLWGGAPVRGQVSDLSSLPRFFEVAYDVARRSADRAFQELAYETMRRYLEWWLSPVKRHAATGLITAIGEETFAVADGTPQRVAAVDTNIAVLLGCDCVARLARRLGKETDAQRYEVERDRLKQAINRYLWHADAGAYLNFDVVERVHHHPWLLCTTFDPLRLGVAPPERIPVLLDKLLDPHLFNWGKRPVTSFAMTMQDYVEATGPYDGRAWFGDIWTLRNLPIVTGLSDIGRHDLAAELNWSTIRTFNTNYTEYVVPSTGAGEGVARYGWSASQYIQCIVEHLFGVDYDRLLNRLRVFPRVPAALCGERLGLERVILPTGADTRLNVHLEQSAPGRALIRVEFEGAVPEGAVEIWLPADQRVPATATDAEGRALPLLAAADDLTQVRGVRLSPARRLAVRFE